MKRAVIAAALALCACDRPPHGPAAPAVRAPGVAAPRPGRLGALDTAPIRFVDVAAAAGVALRTPTFGVCWGDFDGDGRPDLYSTNHAAPPHLFHNRGDGTFGEERAQRFDAATLPARDDTHGCAWGDFDNDGDGDLVEAMGGARGAGGFENLVWRNDGGVLRNVAGALGLAAAGASGRTPLWLDADGDGRLDLLLANLEQRSGQPTSRLYLQKGGGFVAQNGPAATPDLGSGLFAVLVHREGAAAAQLMLWNYGGATVFDPHLRTAAPLHPTREAHQWDAVPGDFNGDLRQDLWVVNYDGSGSGVAWGADAVAAHLKAARATVGFRFSAAATVSIELWGSPIVKANEVFVGRAGAAAAATRGPNRELVFTLSPTDAAAAGLALDPATAPVSGVYAGREDGQWTVLFSWADPLTRMLNVVARAPGAVTGAAPVNFVSRFSNPIAHELLLQNGDGTFAPPVAQPPRACKSAVAGDFDNDMDLDLFLVCRGLIDDLGGLVLANDGAGVMTPVAGAAGAPGEGFGDVAAVADYDGDGFLDVFVAQGDGPGPRLGAHRLWHNAGNHNHWVAFDLVGRASNRDGVGARVYVTAGGVTQVRAQNGGMGFAHQDFRRLHFGLGAQQAISYVKVVWPGGRVQELHPVGVDRVFRIDEAE